MMKFTDLNAWKMGLELVKEIYILTRKFPKEEIYGLTSQIRRCSTSILANLAEGFGRFTYPDKAAKFTIARGESAETEAFLLIAVSLNFITAQDAYKAIELTRHVGRLISGLIASTKAQIKHP